MKPEEFEKAINDYLHIIKANLIDKAIEYAPGADRLANFNKGSNITGEIREKVLFGFALKHLVSIMDMIEDIEKGELPTNNKASEKIGDLGTYMAILYACIQDRLNKTRPF
tara:strand:+ start:186 stop:518 length:333 start_codon:yes stop_codon:yes gene_type:complete